jgi:hypothetical protein
MKKVSAIRIYSGGVLFASGLGIGKEERKTIQKVLDRVAHTGPKLTKVTIQQGMGTTPIEYEVVYINEEKVRINGRLYNLIGGNSKTEVNNN